LGGPQAGIIVGKAAYVAALRKNPLFRALRCDKLILCALQSTVDLYLQSQHQSIPLLQMFDTPIDALRQRAQRIVLAIDHSVISVTIAPSQSQPGGGSLPRATIPSIAIEISHP